MSSVGLVLGGGGVTGGAYEMAALMAIELATGWDPDDADVVIGTSAGSYVAGVLRLGRLDLDTLVRRGESRLDVSERIASHLFVRRPGVRVRSWVRHGLLPGIRRPGLTMLLGSPAPFDPIGLKNWFESQSGHDGEQWPDKPTVVVAYDIRAHERVAFGTDSAPDVSLSDAVAASSAIPLVFRPHTIDGREYVDGGVVSGTHADLVLGSPKPLDLVLILAPMAADERREGAWLHEGVLDRVGIAALEEEIAQIEAEWPDTDILVFRPSPAVLSTMRPNPMDTDAAVPSFIRTLTSMKRTLADPDVWPVLERHLIGHPAPTPR